MKKELPSKEILLECFDYRDDGSLIWKIRPRSHFKNDNTWNNFNNRYPGTKAGSRRGDQYLYTYISGKPYSNHRIVAKIFGIDLSQDIDHIDGDKINNRFENLRSASSCENFSNRKKNTRNKIGVKGLSISTSRGGRQYFQCEVQHKKIRHIKHFPFSDENKELAIIWIEVTRLILHKEFTNHGNGSILLNKE